MATDTQPVADGQQWLPAYQAGLDAGHAYFRNGVDHGRWLMPDASPFETGTENDAKWWDGFWHGEGDAETAYEYDYADDADDACES